MTEKQEATETMFSMWLRTLNAEKLASEESFLSEAHRFAMLVHEKRKVLFARSVGPREKQRKERVDREQLGAIRFARFTK